MTFKTLSDTPLRASRTLFLTAWCVASLAACGGDSPTGAGSKHDPTITVVAKAYLDTAVSYPYTYFYYHSRVNWDTLYSHAYNRARDAQTTAQTWPAIDSLLRELNDPHTFFYLPSQTLGVNDDPATPFYTPTEWSPASRVAYLWVPTFGGKSMAGRGDTIQKIIARGDSTPNLCGWILDLRGNPGGLWPAMLAGLSPLITPGIVGGFVGPSNSFTVNYEVQPGYAGFIQDGTHYTGLRLAQTYTLAHPGLPLAILQGDITASAGEIIVMSFKEPARAVRTFGANTYGVTSQPYTFQMRDTASLQITAAIMFDRQGHGYDGGAIAPDQAVAGPTIRSSYVPAQAHDAVLDAATIWVKSQPSCTTSAAVADALRIPDPTAGRWRAVTPPPSAIPLPKGKPSPFAAGVPVR